MPRLVVAAFGNELRGDDGFGVVALRRLEATGRAPAGTVFLEVGTGGLALAQELLTPCDRLVILDALNRGGPPGRVYVLQVDEVPPARSIDMHLTVPARALGLASAMGTMPREVFIVGCEPANIDELSMVLSAPVSDAVDAAVTEVQSLLERPHA